LARRRGHGDGDAVVRFCTYTPPSFQSCFSTAPALLCSALLCSALLCSIIPSWSLVRCPSSVEFSPAFGLSSSHLTSYHLVSFLISSRTTSSARYDTSRIHVYLSIYIYIPPINLSIYPSILVAKRTSSSSSLLRTALHHLTPKTNLDTAPSVSHLAFVASLPRCLVALLLCCIALHCVVCCVCIHAVPRHDMFSSRHVETA
jgi:hypothetical protein